MKRIFKEIKETKWGVLFLMRNEDFEWRCWPYGHDFRWEAFYIKIWKGVLHWYPFLQRIGVRAESISVAKLLSTTAWSQITMTWWGQNKRFFFWLIEDHEMVSFDHDVVKAQLTFSNHCFTHIQGNFFPKFLSPFRSMPEY